MPVSTARPSVTPLVSWDKAQQTVKPAPKRSNPALNVIMVAIIILVIVGLWRAFNKPTTGQWVEVMAAKGDIQIGSRIGITNITFLQVPKQFSSPEMIMSLNDATGRVARTFIPSGEPIKEYMLFQGRGGLSSNLAGYERAITLQLDDEALVDHAIMPEDRVDIMVASNKDNKKFTKTICQSARVLMAAPKEQVSGRHSMAGSGNKITLALTPAQTEIVNQAAETGKIRLVLRSRVSKLEQNLSGAGPESLLPSLALAKDRLIEKMEVSSQLIPPPPAQGIPTEMSAALPPNPIQWMVEVISGGHRETYAVPEK